MSKKSKKQVEEVQVETTEVVETPKTVKEPRPMISRLVYEIFTRNVVPTNEAIIQEIKDKFTTSKFDERHLAWYKTQYRKGRMVGQDETQQYTINQLPKPKKVKATESNDVAA